jgi:hypothetical protein
MTIAVRREWRSAQAPHGTSASTPTTDQRTKSPEISAAESPLSANSRA